MQITRAMLTEIWDRPGVMQPGHLCAWDNIAKNFGLHELTARRGAKMNPAWDKALLKRAKRDLPNWYAARNKPYY